ncbi:hypothetical protein [Anaerotignum sp.]|uniref:hypothetical protein n=1 Tax=Anaerotignum sp. TaxID=2039241 RepID=UPI003736B3A3
MKRDELDAMIQKAMEKRTEHLKADPMMLERIKREAASRERKERISMKLFTAKRIAVIAVVCFASVTCYAAVRLSGVEASTSMNITSYAQVEKAEEKVGFDMKTVETFSNGFTFVNGGTGEMYGQDENGNNVGEPYALMALSYEKEGKTLVVTAQDGNPYPDAGQGYSSQLYKFVPEGYELTAEDQEREASGELIISYGTDEVMETAMEIYSWKDGDLFYSMTAENCDLGEDTMAQMAAQMQNS